VRDASKLEQAQEAARLNPEFMRNVEALKEAQPEKLGPSQISVKLGASFVPVSHVNEFATLIGAGAVQFDVKTETWTVEGANLRTGRNAGNEYGTAKRTPSELLEAILNSRSIKVMMTVDKKTVTDTNATTAANEVAKRIKDKFKGWVWTDSERATELVEMYNKQFNNIAPRKFDGSHLTLPGVSLRFKLHPHQLRAIWRMVQTGNTYLAHAVGAGKTIEMIAGGMELAGVKWSMVHTNSGAASKACAVGSCMMRCSMGWASVLPSNTTWLSSSNKVCRDAEPVFSASRS